MSIFLHIIQCDGYIFRARSVYYSSSQGILMTFFKANESFHCVSTEVPRIFTSHSFSDMKSCFISFHIIEKVRVPNSFCIPETVRTHFMSVINSLSLFIFFPRLSVWVLFKDVLKMSSAQVVVQTHWGNLKLNFCYTYCLCKVSPSQLQHRASRLNTS